MLVLWSDLCGGQSLQAIQADWIFGPSELGPRRWRDRVRGSVFLTGQPTCRQTVARGDVAGSGGGDRGGYRRSDQ
eukprot:5716925-Pyramimonas_sp.AAC.1